MDEAFTVALLVTVGAFLAVLALEWAASFGDDTPPAPQRVPFLGGGSQEVHAWSRFHARYYPMALLFVAFEMEMMFMYPWAVVYVDHGITALAEMGIFLAILGVGVVYAWREGAFRWQ